MNQGPPLRARPPQDFDGQPPNRAASAWSIFEKNPIETLLELRDGRCGPSVITWMPAGSHCICPTRLKGNGSGNYLVWHTKQEHAKIADRHLQAMRAKAAAGEAEWPHFDFEHKGGNAAEVLGFFWHPAHGIRAHVRWSAEGERAILEGRCKKFSPVFAPYGDDLVGVIQNCGALLSNDSEPAFGRKMPWIHPTTKLKAMKACEELFLNLVDAQTTALKNAGDVEFPALRAFDFIKKQYPVLHESFALHAALKSEFGKDFTA